MKTAYILILIFAVSCFAGITYGPYLTWPSTDGAMVQFGKDVWDSAEIYWADSVTYASIGTLPNSSDIGELDSRASYHITGFPPSTRIYYQVSAGSDISPVYSFRTMPIIGSSVNFIIYGDTRTGVDKHTEICEMMIEHNIHFVLHTGDLGDAAWDIDDWDMYFEAVDTIANKIPYISTIGNHEIPYTIYKYLFDLPANEEWYSFHIGCVSVVVINLYNNYAPGSDQYEWLEATLADSIPSTSLYTIILEHESPYSTSNHGGNPLVLEYLKPLYDSYNVDVVAAGHDHCYEHSYADGVHYFVAGGAGAPLYSVDGGPYTVYMESAYHYIEATADSEDLCFNTWRDDGVLIEAFCLSDFPIAVRETPKPESFNFRAWPNPFNSAITFSIDASVGAYCNSPLQIEVYDVAGHLIQLLSEPDFMTPQVEVRGGIHREKPSTSSGGDYVWQPNKSLGSGIYLVRATVGEKTATRRVIYLK